MSIKQIFIKVDSEVPEEAIFERFKEIAIDNFQSFEITINGPDKTFTHEYKKPEIEPEKEINDVKQSSLI